MPNNEVPELSKIADYLNRALASQKKLTANDIDPQEIVAQLAENLRLQQYRWADSQYLPNIVNVLVLETKPNKVEALEVIFCAPEFARLLVEAAKSINLEALMPVRAEVELVKPNYPALIPGSERCAVTLSWPKMDDSLALADVVVDQEHHRIIAIHVRRSSMPIIARLTSLNAEVYRNNYLLIRENTHIGRLRIVVDDKTGLFVRRNDFVFAQNDDVAAICNSVSRQQAIIKYQLDGCYYIEDSGSANATVIERESEGKILVKGSPTRLQHNDIICFGLAKVRFILVEHIDPTILLKISTEQEQHISRVFAEEGRVTMQLPKIDTSLYQ